MFCNMISCFYLKNICVILCFVQVLRELLGQKDVQASRCGAEGPHQFHPQGEDSIRPERVAEHDIAVEVLLNRDGNVR